MMITASDNHFLFPGTLFVTNKPMQLQTLLGSCIAVCLFDGRKKIAGMNHFLLPFWNGDGLASPKYGNIAIELLLEKMQQAGSLKQDLIAKVFGGASQFATKNSILSIGENNIEIARTTLDRLQIKIAAESTGGSLGRKILMDSQTGQIMMRLIQKQET